MAVTPRSNPRETPFDGSFLFTPTPQHSDTPLLQLGSRRSSVIVIKSFDVILFHIVAVLDFNDLKGLFPGVLQPMPCIGGNIRALIGTDNVDLAFPRDARLSRNHDPMLTSPFMALKAQPAFWLQDNPLDLVPGSFLKNRITSPRFLNLPVEKMFFPSPAFQSLDDLPYLLVPSL